MLDHGGEEVPRDQVRPGDIIHYEQAGDNEEIGKGNTHHAAGGPARTALWVPVLVALGIAGLVVHDAAEKAHLKAAWVHCDDTAAHR
ncbi:hypothetical protein [Streptomyces monomycini]|uniref:hypothetical protein n=1 Tax=Streptomyces monomycini TaxID=371720 RepID=UPI0004AA7FEC|nr:hypothetical protein [Streptomyces monomycini]